MALTQKTQQDYDKFNNPDEKLIKAKTSSRALSKSIRKAKQEVKVEAKKDDTSDKWQAASTKLSGLQKEKGEMKGWSEKKMVRKGIIDDPTAEIPTGWSAVWEKGKYVGAEEEKKQPGAGKFSFKSNGDKPKDDSTTRSTSGIGQYQAKEYTGIGSRKFLKAAAKKGGIDPGQSNKKLREALMAAETHTKSETKGVYTKREDDLTSGEIIGKGIFGK